MQARQALETWTIRKPAVTNKNGLVASHHYLASDIGADVLRRGGNAIDAALSASLAIGTQEPWMSGLGGGGFMMIYLAAQQQTYALDFGMMAPRRLDPADYPLSPGTGSDLFNWPAVVDDRNLRGYHSIAVPGYVAGLALALERFGTYRWADIVEPAIELAANGMTVDWYATLKIATAAADLARYDESRRVYLPNGFAPAGEWAGLSPTLKLGKLADTLKRLASAGPRDFYEGEIARSIVADCDAGGSKLSLQDLSDYQAQLLDAEKTRYRDTDVFHAPGLSAGPSLARALQLLETTLRADAQTGPDADTYAHYVNALQQTYTERLASMGAGALSPAPSCTTHLSVIDKTGNMVALTQTLLSVFGSKVMLPQTGLLMNNGIMWFDPRPGGPNSIAAGKKPLSNMCPTIIHRDRGISGVFGASGGRRIMPAVFQLLSFLIDYEMTLEEAFHQPRIDSSGTDLVTLDSDLDAAISADLSRRYRTQTVTHGVYPAMFACPNGLLYDTDTRQQTGAAYIPSPWAKVSCA